MSDDQREIYRIALSMLKGVTVANARVILDALGGDEGAFFTFSTRELQRLTGLSPSFCTDSYRAALITRATEELRNTLRHNIRRVYFADEAYPQRLLECADAPVMLYILGDIDLNARHVVGIVGTRSATINGVEFINRLVDDLHEKIDDVLIVSGLAAGCDIAAHRRAMACGVPTAAVVAHGLDTLYPADHRRDAARMAHGLGAIISDYPLGTRPMRGNFLARNRIVAGMCDCVVVAESAASHGGALKTARLAYDYDRDVFAMPGRVSDTYSGGCNNLIRRNIAHLCTCADDLLETMGWEPRPTAPRQQELFTLFTPQEQMVMDQLSAGDVAINTISTATGLPINTLRSLLMKLEMDGHVTAIPGGRYRKG